MTEDTLFGPAVLADVDLICRFFAEFGRLPERGRSSTSLRRGLERALTGGHSKADLDGRSFRYLLHVLNPRSTVTAPLVFPFVFNKFVYLGFHNLDVAVTVILCAYWLRDPRRLSGGRP
jgi:hypothetical protein